MKNEKKHNQELFVAEAVIGVAATAMLLIAVTVVAVLMETQVTAAAWLVAMLIGFFTMICLGLTKMEQVVGYYVCENCHHKQVPSYNAVLWSLHLGRTRRMKCPKCHKKTWQKKVL